MESILMTDHTPHPNWAPLSSSPAIWELCTQLTNRVDSFDEWSRRTRDPRGRTQHHALRVTVTSLLVTMYQTRRAQVSLIDRIQQGLAAHDRYRLGIPSHGPPILKREKQRGKPRRWSKPHEPLIRRLSAMCDAIDYSPVYQSKLTDDERRSRREFQHRVLDDLVSGWFIGRIPYPEMLTHDATGIRGFARRGKDPDFKVVHQTATGRDDVKFISGSLGCILGGAALPSSVPFPHVALSYRLPPHDETDNAAAIALEMIDRWRERGGPGLPLVGDSLYGHAEDLSLNLGRRGCALVTGLQTTDAGRKWPDPHGSALIDGCPHCPYTDLRTDLLLPKPNEPELDREFRDAIHLRQKFACEAVEETSEQITFICPAQAGKVRCPMWPDLASPSDFSLPRVECPPASVADAPPVCRGPITVSREAKWIRKIWMPFYYGGDEWHRYWSAGRPAAEGLFGCLFGDNVQDADVGVTNWVGQARTALVYAAALAVVNVQMLRLWFADPAIRAALPEPVVRQLECDPLLLPLDELTGRWHARHQEAA
jgi:hypothetical protein